MNGELAALIAQCLHGNEWLASGTGPAPSLDTSNSAFQYVARLHATCPQRRIFGRKTWEADGVAPWLEFLRDSGTRRLSLVIAGSSVSGLPDHVAVSFAGGGRWALASDGPLPRLWRSQWAVQDRDRPDRRIWVVELAGAPVAAPWPAHAVDGSAEEDLRRALAGIGDYAHRAGLDEWTPWFAEALRILDSSDPAIPYNPDLAPASLPLASRRLLAGAVKAWVFGGMGSWNDVALSDPALAREYDRWTAELYSAVLAAVVAVTDGAA